MAIFHAGFRFIVADEILTAARFSVSDECGCDRRIGDQRVHEIG